MPDRETRALTWLRSLGHGRFTYRQLAEETGMTRGQALAACVTLLQRGEVWYVQWVADYGTDRYELRRA